MSGNIKDLEKENEKVAISASSVISLWPEIDTGKKFNDSLERLYSLLNKKQVCILKNRIHELESALESKSTITAIVMMGSVLEGAMIFLIERQASQNEILKFLKGKIKETIGKKTNYEIIKENFQSFEFSRIIEGSGDFRWLSGIKHGNFTLAKRLSKLHPPI